MFARRAMEEGRAELSKKNGVDPRPAGGARTPGPDAAPAKSGPVQRFAGYGQAPDGYGTDGAAGVSQPQYAARGMDVPVQGVGAVKKERMVNLRRDGFTDATLSDAAQRYADGGDRITADMVRPSNDPGSIRHTSSYLELKEIRREHVRQHNAAKDKERGERYLCIEGDAAPSEGPTGQPTTAQSQQGTSAVKKRPVVKIQKSTNKHAPQPHRRANTPPPTKYERAAVVATFESEERAHRGVKGVVVQHSDASSRYGSIFASFTGERNVHTPGTCDDYRDISPKKTSWHRLWVFAPARDPNQHMKSPPLRDEPPSVAAEDKPKTEIEFELHQQPLPLRGILAKVTYFVNHNKMIIIPVSLFTSAVAVFAFIQSVEALVANPVFGLLVGLLVSGGLARASAQHFLVYYSHFVFLSSVLCWFGYKLFLNESSPPDVWENLYGKRRPAPEPCQY